MTNLYYWAFGACIVSAIISSLHAKGVAVLYRPVPPTAIGALVPSCVSSNSFLYDMKCVYHLFWGGLQYTY